MLPLLACVVAFGGAAHSARVSPDRTWTIEDIVEAPHIDGLQLSNDGRFIAYVVRSADLKRNRDFAELHLVDAKRGGDRVLLRADVIRQLRRIPGTREWSVLADIGEGLQLYRIDDQAGLRTVLRKRDTVTVGSVDGGIRAIKSGSPLNVGVMSYDWSPDGKWLWYTTLHREMDPLGVLFDRAVENAEVGRRPASEPSVEYHLRDAQGHDVVVASRPAEDRIAFSLGGNVSWALDEVHFFTERAGSEVGKPTSATAFNLKTHESTPLAAKDANPFGDTMVGPHGGNLQLSGLGSSRRLWEITTSGERLGYGTVPFLIGDPRSAGYWRSRDGSATIIGTRYVEHPRYGLAVLSHGGIRQIAPNHSLTHCDFEPDLLRGACVSESIARPPRIVLLDTVSGHERLLLNISPRFEKISPLKVTPRTWVNRLGYSMSGFVIWPHRYVQGKRYPTIVVTHGSDADERFAETNLQWNYPVQVLAEEGYFVLLLNDPSPSQSARLAEAYDEWGDGGGKLGPATVQDLVWVNGAISFEDAIHDLVREGLVDPARVGIAGYSRGSQMVNVAMTQSTIFRAASSGDGGFLEPSGYGDAPNSYRAIFGGTPFGPALVNYQRLSPSLRASNASGPILQQMASPMSGAIEFYRALKRAGIPTQISLYPGENAASDETHVFHIPSNRNDAMRENLAWFDFWLLGRRRPDMPFPARYRDWERMVTAKRGSMHHPNVWPRLRPHRMSEAAGCGGAHAMSDHRVRPDNPGQESRAP
ncbi:MAG: prolyl oligopeptidase family serine peptidase [Sphingomonas sp.]|nr:prolyl oligopeptidase family serine peptidase [Sphingomonas sp.]